MYLLIGLLLIYHLFLVGEFMLPTGGLLGIAALVSVISAIAIGFSISLSAGAASLGVVTVSTPIVLSVMIRVWPYTPIGRRILNIPPDGVWETAPVRTTRGGERYSELVGVIGVTKTELLPDGIIRINDDNVEAISPGGPIAAGKRVVVTAVQGTRVHVREASPDEANSSSLADDDTHRADDAARETRSPSALEQSFDLLDDE